jgi:hypothetical protein
VIQQRCNVDFSQSSDLERGNYAFKNEVPELERQTVWHIAQKIAFKFHLLNVHKSPKTDG